MTLRTPRRRISPRTRHRYRAVKNFFRRALGGECPPDIVVNSNIALNVSDLKPKIGGLDLQHCTVNKKSYDFARSDNSFRKHSYTVVPSDSSIDPVSLRRQAASRSVKCENKGRVLYKPSESRYRKSDVNVLKQFNEGQTKHRKYSNVLDADVYSPRSEIQRKQSKIDTRINEDPLHLRKHRTQSACNNLASICSTSSYYSLRDPTVCKGLRTDDTVRYNKKKYCDYTGHDNFSVEKRARNLQNSGMGEEIDFKRQKKLNQSQKIDQSFITDIIKRQYKPVKMFEQKESKFSQFSAPVCRDKEFSTYENIKRRSHLCSCCFDKKSKFKCYHELSDEHSICDTRLYSSDRQMRHNRKQRKRDMGIYNDSELYDLVPVREKSSPKNRRKVATDNTVPYDYIKELPPSPRTQRPQLNLKAQNHNAFEQYQLRHVPEKSFSFKKYDVSDHMENAASNMRLARHEYLNQENISQFKKTQTISNRYGAESSICSPLSNNNQQRNTNKTTLNKTNDTDLSADKTDKTLNEIKDILHSFLLEIKKDATTSHFDNSDATKFGEKCFNDYKPCAKSNSRLNVNVMGATQCNMPLPYMPYTNPCCYPVLPVCPMTCMPNSYIVPSPSFTCATCINNHKENSDNKPTNMNDSDDLKCNETEKLIKEIYNFVAHSSENNKERFGDKIGGGTLGTNNRETNYKLTPRSARERAKLSKHDAIVGTPRIKCYSKSCEAISSKMKSDSYCSRTNATYSDTVLDRLSLEPTATSESESSLTSIPVKAVKQNRFAKVLRSFGLMKKKNNTIEEVSETESTIEVDVKPKSPFRQEVTNYVMHGHDYYNPPPMPRYNVPNHNSPDCGANYHASCIQGFNGNHYCSPQQSPPCDRSAYHSPMPHPSAPPYPSHGSHYNYNQAPVPLCLKEVEVKSMATQSDRKMSFFRKMSRKIQGPAVVHSPNNAGARNCSTQTAGQSAPHKFSKPGKFNWRSLQTKVNELDKPPGGGDFTYKTQKRLAEGDMKIKNAMLKKLFYKRNPFSPRNLIVRTILGKDKSSFGQPPMIARPRMFF